MLQLRKVCLHRGLARLHREVLGRGACHPTGPGRGRCPLPRCPPCSLPSPHVCVLSSLACSLVWCVSSFLPPALPCSALSSPPCSVLSSLLQEFFALPPYLILPIPFPMFRPSPPTLPSPCPSPIPFHSYFAAFA